MLLGNNHETNDETTAVAWQRPVRPWIGWKVVFSAGSTLMAVHATMDGVFWKVHAKGL
jgi:hypothetical protein